MPFSIRGTMRSSQEAERLGPTEIDVSCLQVGLLRRFVFYRSVKFAYRSRLEWFVPEAIDIMYQTGRVYHGRHRERRWMSRTCV